MRDVEYEMKPSDFAARGQPCCSMWGKSEIEWIAHDYVRALAADGDTWKQLTPEQVVGLLAAERMTFPYNLSDEYYRPWFDAVASQLTSADGAAQVWRLSLATLARLAGAR